MVTTYTSIGQAASDYAVALVRIERADGECIAAFQVGGEGGPIFADYPAAVRFADRRRAKDAAHGARLVAAKQAAARVLATAASKATASKASRRGVAVTGGAAHPGTPQARREFGAGLGV